MATMLSLLVALWLVMVLLPLLLLWLRLPPTSKLDALLPGRRRQLHCVRLPKRGCLRETRPARQARLVFCAMHASLPGRRRQQQVRLPVLGYLCVLLVRRPSRLGSCVPVRLGPLRRRLRPGPGAP